MANDALRSRLNKLAKNHDFISGRQVFWWYCGLSWSHWWWQRHSLTDRFDQADVSPDDVMAKLKAYEASTGIVRWWYQHILRREALYGLVVQGLMNDEDGLWMKAIEEVEMGWEDWLPNTVQTWKDKAVDAVEYTGGGVRAAGATDHTSPAAQAQSLSPAERLWAQWGEDKEAWQTLLKTKCQASRMIRSKEESAEIVKSIKEHYHRLAMKYHPDKNPSTQDATTQIFQDLQAVFEEAVKAVKIVSDCNDNNLTQETWAKVREEIKRQKQEFWDMLQRHQRRLDKNEERFRRKINSVNKKPKLAALEEDQEQIKQGVMRNEARADDLERQINELYAQVDGLLTWQPARDADLALEDRRNFPHFPSQASLSDDPESNTDSPQANKTPQCQRSCRCATKSRA